MSNQVIDLRSDTVTKPTSAMYKAMQNAILGDDVLDGDPTVQDLETFAAQKVGMEAALFVPSGCMGNQIALASHCQRGDSILLEEEAHILYYEAGSASIIAGVTLCSLPSNDGIIDPLEIKKKIIPKSIHTPGTTLLCLENTHNRKGGTIIPPETMENYSAIAKKYGLKMHLDGARIFHAAVALEVDVKKFTQHVDSIMFCLSKGLGSPAGSMLCGTHEFIETCKLWRKRLGGGMRQIGILAACGIVSLNQNIERLTKDHQKAKKLSHALQDLPGIQVDHKNVQTNMVMIHTKQTAEIWVEKLKQAGILMLAFRPHTLRAVFHYDISDEELHQAIEVFKNVAAKLI